MTTTIDSIAFELAEYLDAQNDLADGILTEAEENKEDGKEVSEGIINKIIALIKSLKEAVVKLVKDMTDYFRYKMLSADDKAKLDQLRKRVKEHPELGRMEVTVIDFKKYGDAFDKAIDMLDADMAKETATESDAQKAYNWLVNALGAAKEEATKKTKEAVKTGKGFVTRVTLASALEIADSHKSAAMLIDAALKKEADQLNEIENGLSDKEIRKYQKKVNKYAKAGIFHRMKLKILKKESDTFRDVMNRNINNLLSMTNLKFEDSVIQKKDKSRKGISGIISPDDVMSGIAKNPKYANRVFGGPKNTAKVAAKAASAKYGPDVAGKIAKEELHYWLGKPKKK